MGYTGLNGRTLKLMGALSQFGLLEKVGKGQVRVSKNAVSILHWADETEKREAIAEAASSPTLFRRIRDSFDEPSEQSYKETNRFLADNGVAESHGRQDEDASESSDLEEEDGGMIEKPASEFKKPPAPAPARREETFTETLTVTFDMKSVTLTGRTTSPKELRDFIGQLTALADLFDKVGPKEGSGYTLDNV